jgi:hypothetical protein
VGHQGGEQRRSVSAPATLGIHDEVAQEGQRRVTEVTDQHKSHGWVIAALIVEQDE